MNPEGVWFREVPLYYLLIQSLKNHIIIDILYSSNIFYYNIIGPHITSYYIYCAVNNLSIEYEELYHRIYTEPAENRPKSLSAAWEAEV